MSGHYTPHISLGTTTDPGASTSAEEDRTLTTVGGKRNIHVYAEITFSYKQNWAMSLAEFSLLPAKELQNIAKYCNVRVFKSPGSSAL